MAVFASLWLLCVGVVGTAAWYAIDSAGRTTQVLASENRGARVVPAGSSTTPVARPTTDPTEPSEPDDPSSTPSQAQDDASSSTSASSSSTRPSGDGTGRTTTTRTSSRASTSTSRPVRTTTTTTTTTSGARTLLQQTAGGSVSVTCRQDTPIDYVAKPAQGWGVRTNTQGTTEADIKFSDGDQTYEVHAKCAAGEPSASVEHKSNDD